MRRCAAVFTRTMTAKIPSATYSACITTCALYTVAITMSAPTSSTTATVSMNARSRSGSRRPTSASMPSANAVSVDIATPQPCADGLPAFATRKIPIGTTIPPRPASSGRVTRRRCRSSPRSNSRLASSPITKKKNVIRPVLIQPRRSCATPALPIRIDKRVCHTLLYDEVSALTHTSATIVAASRKAALDVSVRMNCRSGGLRLRAQAVRPESGPTSSAVLTYCS